MRVGKIILNDDESYMLLYEDGEFVWRGINNQIVDDFILEQLNADTKFMSEEMSPSDGDPGTLILGAMAESWDAKIQQFTRPVPPKGRRP